MMKTLVFSDTHFTSEFEPILFKKLTELIGSVDRVIINGDFFEGYVVSFDEFAASEWRRLFPLLKEKHAIYLHGNHDTEEMINGKVEQFSVKQALKHTLPIGNKKVIVRHGHTYAPEVDDAFPRITARFKDHYPFFFNLHRSPSYAGKFYRYLKGYHYRSLMRKLQRYAHTQLEKNQILLAGHSHQMVDDRERGFINLGAFQRGTACYAVLDDSGAGTIRLRKEAI